jgi:hypothetical protein
MTDKPRVASPTVEPAPPAAGSPFKREKRRPKGERTQGGRVLPPAPAWMQKPLKPPGVRNR